MLFRSRREDKGKIFNWVFTIARNAAYDYLRKVKSGAYDLIDDLDHNRRIDRILADPEALISGNMPAPDAFLEAQEFIDNWFEILSHMPTINQEIINGILDGRYHSITHAANMLYMYPYEVRNLFKRYMKELRELLNIKRNVWYAVRHLNGSNWHDNVRNSNYN